MFLGVYFFHTTDRKTVENTTTGVKQNVIRRTKKEE